MSELRALQKRIAKFNRVRDWTQFHDDPRNTLLCLGSELGELMEIYRFTTLEQAQQRADTHRVEIEDELGDILYLLLMFCEVSGIDLEAAFTRKEQKREVKYPIAKARSSAIKYDKL